MVGRSPVAEAWVLARHRLLRQACQGSPALVPAGFVQAGCWRGASARAAASHFVAALKPEWRGRPARCFCAGRAVVARTVAGRAPPQRRRHRYPSDGGGSDEVRGDNGGKDSPIRRKSSAHAAPRMQAPRRYSGLTHRGRRHPAVPAETGTPGGDHASASFLACRRIGRWRGVDGGGRVARNRFRAGLAAVAASGRQHGSNAHGEHADPGHSERCDRKADHGTS